MGLLEVLYSTKLNGFNPWSFGDILLLSGNVNLVCCCVPKFLFILSMDVPVRMVVSWDNPGPLRPMKVNQ